MMGWKIRILIALIAALILIPTAYFAFVALDRSGKYLVAITTAPKDAVVMIGGVKIPDREIYLAPGTYEYTVSREHFAEKKGTINITTDKSRYDIIASLIPADQEGWSVYDSKQSEYLELESIAGEEASRSGQEFLDKNPITAKLPYHGSLFSIGYKNNPSDSSGKSIIITIHADPIYYNSAINQLSVWGFNPAEYKIEFVGEENPFK